MLLCLASDLFICVGRESRAITQQCPISDNYTCVGVISLMIVAADQNHDNKGTQDEGDGFFFVDFLHVNRPLAIIRYDLVGLEPVCKGLMYTTAAASGLLEGHCCLS